MISYSVQSNSFYLIPPPAIYNSMNPQDVTNLKQLSNYLRSDLETLQFLLEEGVTVIDRTVYNSGSHTETLEIDSRKQFVLKFKLRKKGRQGGTRVVHSCFTPFLADTLKTLNTNLTQIYSAPDSVHGFVRRRNIKTNALQHLRKKYILSVDIKDFFGSIGSDMVKSNLIKIGFNAEVAELISKMTTIEGHLVQGFHTSPTLSNIVVKDMDEELENYGDGRMTYTRYADDLYFSSNTREPNLSDIQTIIEKHGFSLNESKTKLMLRGRNQYVTGLTVFDSVLPRIPKKIKRNLRLELHQIGKHGLKAHAKHRLKKLGIQESSPDFNGALFEERSKINHRIYGWIQFIMSIEPVAGQKLDDKYQEVLQARDNQL